jgi:hypothetical protein
MMQAAGTRFGLEQTKKAAKAAFFGAFQRD